MRFLLACLWQIEQCCWVSVAIRPRPFRFHAHAGTLVFWGMRSFTFRADAQGDRPRWPCRGPPWDRGKRGKLGASKKSIGAPAWKY
jgi:hypothetical protein